MGQHYALRRRPAPWRSHINRSARNALRSRRAILRLRSRRAGPGWPGRGAACVRGHKGARNVSARVAGERSGGRARGRIGRRRGPGRQQFLRPQCPCFCLRTSGLLCSSKNHSCVGPGIWRLVHDEM
uniref:Acyl-coenzyme A thioesterase 13 isoform X1 n=1 Tax=Camelus bactrianus TaxID=9837 RepID=A0A9W3FRU8_CAMBA|nr:acyl-coenzyme A thioesterase 13 isoform X1 [Camelus bactrianus]